jgi:hypothetical protein
VLYLYLIIFLVGDIISDPSHDKKNMQKMMQWYMHVKRHAEFCAANHVLQCTHRFLELIHSDLKFRFDISVIFIFNYFLVRGDVSLITRHFW